MPPVKLTEYEMNIIRLICKGYSNHEIASELNYCASTIKNGVAIIYNKFGVHSIRKLIFEVYQSGLVAPPNVIKPH
jgi:DNA-binding NarL/FixJ family response regulator